MTSNRRTTSRSRRRMRFRSVAEPFFLVTVKPIRVGPKSSRRARQQHGVHPAMPPPATARKSARCLSRSMIESPRKRSPSGAQTLAAARAACGKHLAAASRSETGTEAVTALAHQFAGLISALHGSFSADRGKSACWMRSRPGMLAGPKRAFSGPKMSRPRQEAVHPRTIGRGLYGSDRFSSIWAAVIGGLRRNLSIPENILIFRVF